MKDLKHLRYFIFGITVLSLYYIILSLKSSYSDILNYEIDISIIRLAIAFLILQLMLFIRSITFIVFIDDKFIQENGKIRLIFSYSLSQIVKYLPGKITGIATQSFHLTGKFSSKIIWNANISYYFLAMFNAGLNLLIFTLFLDINKTITLLLIIPALYLTFLVIEHKLFSKIILIIFKIFRQNSTKPQYNNLNSYLVLFLLNIEIVLYALSWVYLAPSYFSFFKAIEFGLLYYLASFLGAFVFILPSGIFIRETLFVIIGVYFGFPKEMLVIYSIIARIVFTISDIIFLIFNYLYIRVFTKT